MDPRLTDSGYPMQIGNEEYTASMLTDRDFGDLTLYIQSAYIASASNAAVLIEDEDEQKKLRLTAMENAANIGWGTEAGNAIMASPDGMIHLGFQMIRKRHPKIKFSQFKKEVYSDWGPSIRSINDADIMLNYIKKDEGTPGGSPTGSEKSV